MSIDHKLDLETLNGICPSGYFKSTPCVWKPDDDHESINGIGYIMCERLNDFQKDTLRQYPNVVLSVVRHRYGPEIIYDMVFIGDSNRPDRR